MNSHSKLLFILNEISIFSFFLLMFYAIRSYDKSTYLEFEQPDPKNPNLFTLNIEMNADIVEENAKRGSEK